MTRMTITKNALKTAISHTLPVAARSGLFVLERVQFIVGDNELHIVATDRFMAVAVPLKATNIEDKRRIAVTLTVDQLRVINSWLNYMAPPVVKVRITDVAVTLDPDGDSPLIMKTSTRGDYPAILPILRTAWSDEAIMTAPSIPKMWNPGLISHLRGVTLWSTGGDMKSGLFTADGGAFGIIMPKNTPADTFAEGVRAANPSIFEVEDVPTPAVEATVTRIDRKDD